MTHFFVAFAFLCSSLLSFISFALNQTNSFRVCLPNSSFTNPITFLFFLLDNDFFNSKFEVPNLVSKSSAISY